MEFKELIRLCLLEDRGSQKLLYETFVTPMSRLCLRYLKDEQEAQDALIEGFVKVFEMLKKFDYRGEQSLEVWIRKIMINQCLMSLRKRRNRMWLHYGEEKQGSRKVDATTEFSAKEITDLVLTLPEGYRLIFNLFAIDGYSHKEISDMLGITESASRSQLTHARNKLKELLRTHGWK